MARLIDFLVCDDVRFEQGGKLTLVGVYPDGIAARFDPGENPISMLRLGLFARVLFDEDRPLPDAVKIRCSIGAEEVFSVQGTMAVHNPSHPVAMPFVAEGPVTLRPGELAFEFTFLRGSDLIASLKPRTLPITVQLP